MARKAGDATAEASSTLAEKSRSWAAGVRDSLGSAGGGAGTATATAEAPSAPEADVDRSADAGDPPPA